jgi:hypothetical protein
LHYLLTTLAIDVFPDLGFKLKYPVLHGPIE